MRHCCLRDLDVASGRASPEGKPAFALHLRLAPAELTLARVRNDSERIHATYWAEQKGEWTCPLCVATARWALAYSAIAEAYGSWPLLPPRNSERQVTPFFFIVRAGVRFCAFKSSSIEETTPPLRFETMPDVPRFVLGVAIVRGSPVPVVDLRLLLGEVPRALGTRFVILRTGDARRVALLVDEVVGLVEEARTSRFDLPPLLNEAPAAVVEALSGLDDELLMVLKASALVPAEAWTMVANYEARS